MIVVDAVSWPGSYGAANGAYGREDGVLRGVVERVDYRSGTIWLRDEASGQLIDAETGRGGYGRTDVGGLQRGDYVELSGHWDRGGSFDTASIDVLRDRRY